MPKRSLEFTTQLLLRITADCSNKENSMNCRNVKLVYFLFHRLWGAISVIQIELQVSPTIQKKCIPMKPFINQNGIKLRVSPTISLLQKTYSNTGTAFFLLKWNPLWISFGGVNVGLSWKRSGLTWTFRTWGIPVHHSP